MKEDVRRNIRGRRKSWNNVSDVKMMAGSSEWPVSEYVTKDRTAARTGIANATALFADRRISNDLTYLSNHSFRE